MNDILRLTSGSLDADEAAMRRSLGLDRSTLRTPAAAPRGGPGATQMQTGQARARHRLRQDGEIQIEIAEIGRASPRNSAGNGHHAELEQLQAALQQERAAREHAEHNLQQARDALRTLQTQVAHADMAHRETIAAEHALQDMRDKLAVMEAARMRPSRLQRQVAEPDEPGSESDPKPVQWWLPGWKGRPG